MVDTIVTSLIGLLCTVITATITGVLIPALSNWLKSKTENEKLKSVIDDLTQTVKTSVDYLEQTVVNQLKADGKWSSESQAAVLSTAVSEVTSNITSSTAEYIKNELIDLDDLVTRYIESYIRSKKS